MNACTIWSSLMPTLCIWAMRSLAGLEKWHSNILQVATESLQPPHWHCKRAPTRRTSTLGFSLAVWASAATAMTKTSRLLLNRCIFLGISHHFRAGVLQFDFTRHQAHQGAEDDRQGADPDPGDEREHVRLNHDAFIIVAHAAEIQVKVFVGPHSNAHLTGSLLARRVKTLLRRQRAQHLTVPSDSDSGAVPGIIGLVALRQVHHAQFVDGARYKGSYLHGVADVEFLDFVLIEGVAGETDEGEHDPHVHQVAAVAPRVAVRQFDDGARQMHLVLGSDGFRPLVEFHKNGERHEETEAEGNERVELAGACRNQHRDQHYRRDARIHEVAPQALGGGATPSEQRTHAGEEQEEQSDGHHQPVVPIGVERNFVARNSFADDREQGAPEYGETARQQDQVIEQEAGFARNHALQLGLAL